ncbi:MAG: sugar phosphate isomerase/epimerase family protein, partial [Thermomicrobiales bacterium]
MREPKFSVCEFTTMPSSFAEDLATYRTAGAQGIGIVEAKLPAGRDDHVRQQLRESGLQATLCIPATQSILPLTQIKRDADPEVRVASIAESLRRFAGLGAETVVVVTGPQGEYSAEEARRIVVDGLHRLARVGAEAGVGVSLEPIHTSMGADWTTITTIPETVDLLDEVGEPNVQILFDTWHLWDTPGVLDDIARNADRFAGVHVNDWREPPRSWADRLCPGEGAMDLPAIFGALEAAGYDGWYDLEIFSDDGTFGAKYDDSLWTLDPL